jgi:hypothetical protein
MIESRILDLNELTNNPTTTYGKDKDGKFTANIGNYHVSGAYGGVTLHQIMNNGGGVHDTFRCGYTTKRELFNLVCAMIEGVKVK